MSLTISKSDLQGLQRAIKRNPQVVAREAKTMFIRIGSYIDRFLATSPWRIGGATGGVPFDTGELYRNARNRKFGTLSMTIFTNTSAVPYAPFVSEGTSKMEARPYYEAALAGTENEQTNAINQFLDATVRNLAD